ncbi:DNA cytosine methyltransferase [Akkermansia glycaniphila]|uniref:DNA cytosine methyltransferase n=1 Tax=Akkermansia glycaniphila TaxID=1679444 RepID=UPI001C039763|nr:DNA cytosine methyltransferase [Akkermansia glycaniphila]
MNELALFAGAGGGILGGHLLGWRTVCAVEIDPYAAAVLAARQNDGTIPPFPIWDDVRTFDGRLWRGLVNVVSGGFPCQDISAAGKGVGIDGERSGLWREMHRIIGEVRPRYAFMENSPLLVGRGLTRVLSDLAEIGYDAAWEVLGADDVGRVAHGVASRVDRLRAIGNGQVPLVAAVVFLRLAGILTRQPQPMLF